MSAGPDVPPLSVSAGNRDCRRIFSHQDRATNSSSLRDQLPLFSSKLQEDLWLLRRNLRRTEDAQFHVYLITSYRHFLSKVV